MVNIVKKEKIKKTDKVSEIVSKRRFVKVTPDKMRLAAGLIKGKKINDALSVISFSNLAAAKPLELTLKTALSTAKDKDLPEDNLVVLKVFVDEGPKLKRRRIIHQGKATAILKRMSHITVVLKNTSEISKVRSTHGS